MLISYVTDNQDNPFCLARLMTSKFPLLVLLTELAAQLEHDNLALDLGWVPRDQNSEADALTNYEFGDFSAANRIECSFECIPWRILPEMLRASEEVYARVQAAKGASKDDAVKERRAGKKPPAQRLMQRDPW